MVLHPWDIHHIPQPYFPINKKVTEFVGREAIIMPTIGTWPYQLDRTPSLRNSETNRGQPEEQVKAKNTMGTVINKQPIEAGNILETPDKGYIRFMQINTGGINPQGGYAEYKILLANLQQTHSDIFSVNEHCLDTTQPKFKRNCTMLARQSTNMALKSLAPHLSHSLKLTNQGALW